jgi:hypothetical protein
MDNQTRLGELSDIILLPLAGHLFKATLNFYVMITDGSRRSSIHYGYVTSSSASFSKEMAFLFVATSMDVSKSSSSALYSL